MTGTTVAMNGKAKKGGIAKAKKFDFKPVNHAEFAEKGMALYRAPSLLQPHRVRLSMPLEMSEELILHNSACTTRAKTMAGTRGYPRCPRRSNPTHAWLLHGSIFPASRQGRCPIRI